MNCLGISGFSLSPCLPSFCGGAAALRWRTVTANQRGNDGALQQEEIRCGWEVAEGRNVWRDWSFNEIPVAQLSNYQQRTDPDGTTRFYVRDRIRYFREHIESGDFYDIGRSGDDAVIAAKAFGVLGASIPYTIVMMVCNLVAALVHTVIVLRDASSALYFEGIRSCFAQLKTGFTEKVLSDLFIVAASPLYWIAFEVAVLVALVSPPDGMRNMERVERAWHRGASYRDEVARGGGRRAPRQMDLSRPYLFLVRCLHARGNRTDTIDTPAGRTARFANIRPRALESGNAS